MIFEGTVGEGHFGIEAFKGRNVDNFDKFKMQRVEVLEGRKLAFRVRITAVYILWPECGWDAENKGPSVSFLQFLGIRRGQRLGQEAFK